MSESNENSLKSLASLLKQARLAKGLELADVAKSTNIRRDYLIALEEGDYSILPEDIYARNFVRLFSQTVDVDTSKALELFRLERGEHKPISLQTNTNSGYNRADSRRILTWIPAFLLIASLMVLSFWLVNRFFSNANPNQIAGTTSSNTTTSNTTTSNTGTTSTDSSNTISNPASNSTDGTNSLNAQGQTNPATGSDTDQDANNGQEASEPNSSVPRTSETETPQASSGAETPAENSEQTPGPPLTDTETIADAPLDEANVSTSENTSEFTEETILLSIITNPPGAEVNLDGYILPGTTPLIDVPVSSNLDRNLILSLNGYETLEQTLDILQSSTLNFDLIPESAGETSEAVEAASSTSERGELGLRVEDVTWVEVYQSGARGEGERLVYTTLQPGESFVFELPVFVHVGNAGGIRISLNGQDLGLLGSPGEVLSRAYGQNAAQTETNPASLPAQQNSPEDSNPLEAPTSTPQE